MSGREQLFLGGNELFGCLYFISRLLVDTLNVVSSQNTLGYKVIPANSDRIPLPEGFSLVLISIRKGERPKHYISLTVYEVAGERSGLRAEWTTYVLGPGDPKPRVMMLETWTSEGC